jgi:hypothetical protein
LSATTITEAPICGTSAHGKPVASRERDRQDAGAALGFMHQAESLVHGRVGRHLAGGVPKQRQRPESHHRLHFSADGANEQVGSLKPALGHIDVGVGVVADDRRGGVQTALGVVAV